MCWFFAKLEKLYRSTPISLYYSFAYPYFLYCNHVWGKLPLLPWKNIFNTKETYSNYNLPSISNPYKALIFCKKKFWMFVTSMTTVLVLLCMNVYMAIYLIYSEGIFREMLMYMTIIFEMQMIYTYRMGDLISENSVSKLQERICGIPFPCLLKTRNQFISLRKIWDTT